MRFRQLTLITGGIVAMVAQSLAAQLPANPNTVRTQLSQATQNEGKPAVPAAPAKSPAGSASSTNSAPSGTSVKPAVASAKTPKPATAAASSKSKVDTPAKPAKTPDATPKPVASGAGAPAVQTNGKQTTPAPAARRDPFDPLLNKNPAQAAAGPQQLPPGKAGLMITTLHIDGLVHGPSGMIAVVSNPQQRVYFLHEGDRVFDGQVTKITMEAVLFRQSGRDDFGKAQDHDVTRRLYPNPGEQR